MKNPIPLRSLFIWLILAGQVNGELPVSIDFEPGEGFEVGQLDGQNGWTASAWAIAEGGVDVGAEESNAQHVQVLGPATAAERAFMALPVPQAGTVYARLDFRYEGSYDSYDFFWAAFSAESGSDDETSLGVVLRAGNGGSLQFYARNAGIDSLTNSSDFVGHSYGTTYTLVLRAEKTAGTPDSPYDRVSLYVNPDLETGATEPGAPDAMVTSAIDRASLNAFFLRVGHTQSLDSGERILVDSLAFATDWSELTRVVAEPEVVGEVATDDVLSSREQASVPVDFDHDGIADRVEQGLGRDPQAADAQASAVHAYQPKPAHMELLYDRPANTEPYSISVQQSNDLVQWSTEGVDQAAALDIAPDGRQRVTATIARSAGERNFSRIKIADTRLIDELDPASVREFFAKTLSWWSEHVNAAGTKDTFGTNNQWDYEWVMRMLVPMAAWLSQPGRPDFISWNGTTVNVAEALGKALVNGTDPSHPDRWPYAGNSGDQIIVEAPQVAHALWLLHEARQSGAPGGAVWDSFSASERANMQAFLEATGDPSWSYYNNWNLFIVVNHEARKRLQLAGVPEFDNFSQTAINNRLADVQGFHKGGGWYADHERDDVFDDYLPWALLPDQMVTFMMGNTDSQEQTVIPNTGGRGRSQILADAASWLQSHVRMFDAFGGNPEYGRSSTYKFARLRTMVTAYVMDRYYNTPEQWNLGFSVLPPEVGPGMLRRLVRMHLNQYLRNGVVDFQTGQLRNGQTPASSPEVLDHYTHDGSRYWALFPVGTLLLLPDDDPLWSTPEVPLPAETHAFENWFQAPRMLVRNAPDADHLELFNVGAERPSWTKTTYAAKYNKYAYSTHFGYCTASGTRLDQNISVGSGFRDNPSSGDYFIPEDRAPNQPGVIRTTHNQSGSTVKTLIFLRDDLQVRVNRVLGGGGRSIREAGYPLGHDSGESPASTMEGPDWMYLESSDGAVLTARLHGFSSVQLLSGSGNHSRKANWRLPYADLASASNSHDTAVLLVARRESFDPAALRQEVHSVSFDNNVATVTWSDGSSTSAEFP